MKVAITCDSIISRNHYTEIVESLCEMLPEARLYCFAHQAGHVLGHIEKRMITSTHLSKKVKSEEDFLKYTSQLPFLANNLFVSCEYDLIINISNGFSQGIRKCDHTRMVTYLYETSFSKKFKKTLFQKFFFPLVLAWSQKSLSHADLVIVSRSELLSEFNIQNKLPEVIPPPFRISDFSLFPSTMFPHHFYAIEASGLSLIQARSIISWMTQWGFNFQFIGSDEHLESLKKEFDLNKFFGNRCSGELAPVLAASKALVSFNANSFPQLALAAMATGRPVILIDELKKWGTGVGIYFTSFNKDVLKRSIDEMLSQEAEIDSKKIRAFAVEFHDIKFKAHMKRIIDSFAQKTAEKT